MVEFAAFLGCAILACLAIFQIALIAGAPIGKYSWGGAHMILPPKLRIASASSIVLYALFAVILLCKAGVLSLLGGRVVDIAIWIVTAYFFVGIFMNAISRSKPERMVMTPVASMLAISFLIVAMG